MSDPAALSRRAALGGAAAFLALADAVAAQERCQDGNADLYGLIGKMISHPGKRAELIGILTEGTQAMPGCLAYVVAEDRGEADAIWITEVWNSRQAHADSLKLPAVRAAIARGRPLIAKFETSVEIRPVAGPGLRP